MDIEKYYRGSTLFEERHKVEWQELLNPESTYYSTPSVTSWYLPTIIDRKNKATISTTIPTHLEKAINEKYNTAGVPLVSQLSECLF